MSAGNTCGLVAIYVCWQYMWFGGHMCLLAIHVVWWPYISAGNTCGLVNIYVCWQYLWFGALICLLAIHVVWCPYMSAGHTFGLVAIYIHWPCTSHSKPVLFVNFRCSFSLPHPSENLYFDTVTYNYVTT